MKRLSQMTEGQLGEYFNWLARELERELPPGPSAKGKALFCLLVTDTIEPGTAQYVSNVVREDMVKMLRETADRLENREDTPR